MTDEVDTVDIIVTAAVADAVGNKLVRNYGAISREAIQQLLPEFDAKLSKNDVTMLEGLIELLLGIIGEGVNS